MNTPKSEVGTTHHFVLSQGFIKISSYDALIGADGTKRLFAELFANTDRPDVRPQEAYQTILCSMQPGWTLRLLQMFWPDPAARLAYQNNIQNWPAPSAEGRGILQQGLLIALQQYPLPFARRTILEFVLPGEEGLAWWSGLAGLCAVQGMRIQLLSRGEISQLAYGLFNPFLEQ